MTGERRINAFMKTRMKKIVLLILVLGVAAAVGFGYLSNRSAMNSGVIRVSGNIEITDVEVSFEIAGRVAQRLVSEGETVKAGQVVARLDSTELAQEVALRGAELKATRATLAELEAGSRPEEIGQAYASVQKAQARLDELLAGSRQQEVAAARATVQRSRAELDRVAADYERLSALFAKKAISAREYEVSLAAFEMAKARLREAEEHLKLVEEGPRKEQIEQARASLKETREQYELVKKGPRQEVIEQARASVQQSQEALALAETRLGYATLIAPISGIVLSEHVEHGEYVAPGTPVVTIGDLHNAWLRAYINETDLGRVKIGQAGPCNH